MGTAVLIVVIAFIFFIIGVFLLHEKGGLLIAGYNTASSEEKAKYNKSNLRRVIAKICFVVALLLCVMAYLGYKAQTGIISENVMLPFALVLSQLLWQPFLQR